MKRLVLTLEYSDGRPSKSSMPFDPESLPRYMRELAWDIATGRELIGIYVTREDCLQFLPKEGMDL